MDRLDESPLVVVDAALADEIAERNRTWKSYVDPAEPGRRYFSIDFDCVSYTVVARDEAHVKEIFPGIYDALTGGAEYQDRSYTEAIADSGDPEITEIAGTTTIWCDQRDGLQHPINTYPLGTWASSEY